MSQKTVVRNLDSLERKLKQLAALARADVLESALTAGAQEIRNAAVEKAPGPGNGNTRNPPPTGTLRRSIHTETDEKSDTRVSVLVGTNLEYAAMQEFGGVVVPRVAKMLAFMVDGKLVFAKSVTIPAHPYLRPAFDEQRGAAVDIFRKSMGDQIRHIANSE